MASAPLRPNGIRAAPTEWHPRRSDRMASAPLRPNGIRAAPTEWHPRRSDRMASAPLRPNGIRSAPSRAPFALTGVLPSFHHITHLTSLYRLSAAYNYVTSTADAFPFNTTSPDPDDPSGGHSACLFTHNCLEWVCCGYGLNQRRDSECRAFCGVQVGFQVQPLTEQRLTSPCSGHGMCSFVPDPSHAMSPCDEDEEFWPPHCEPVGQCTCDEGYTTGTTAGTCVSRDTLPVPQGMLVD
ncbi:unnamed protein product [Closterium sp. Naga37s-1]|nr:unnamed protein product [Closterium sp. Naga37s-1]